MHYFLHIFYHITDYQFLAIDSALVIYSASKVVLSMEGDRN